MRSSITRHNAFSKFVSLPTLDRLRLCRKIAGVKSCHDSNVTIDERPAWGQTPLGRHFYTPKPGAERLLFFGGANEQDYQFSGAHRPPCPPA